VRAATPEFAASTDYAAFVDRVAKTAQGLGSRPGDVLHFAVLAVGARAGDPGLVPGEVPVPVSATGLEALNMLRLLGPSASAAAAAAAEQRKSLDGLRTQVERRLRLRVLRRDPRLAPERFRAACLRMLRHSRELFPLLDGLPVRIAEVNGLPGDRSCVDIAWDFQI
jgi:hypothetical protein